MLQKNDCDFPTPPLPPYIDLRDFAYMPLNVAQLRGSDIVALAEPAEFMAAVLLWCASWHQVPAASLPNDDKILASLAGYGRAVDAWLAVKPGALRGFTLCSDGRFYHAVIAMKAVEAWAKYRSQRQRTKAATAARMAKRNKPTNDGGSQRDVDVTRKRDVHQGKGREGKEGFYESRIDQLFPDAPQPPSDLARHVNTDWPENYRDVFWSLYPRKTGKAGAMRKLEAIKRSGRVKFGAIMNGVTRYVASNPDPQYTKHPETWLNKGCWDDEYPAKPHDPDKDWSRGI